LIWATICFSSSATASTSESKLVFSVSAPRSTTPPSLYAGPSFVWSISAVGRPAGGVEAAVGVGPQG
ncbi:MAG TPA: hypothetical protein VM529_18770, partial [Gemmata sp.]|nr:hypothetical protein [Gemmata sp.]